MQIKEGLSSLEYLLNSVLIFTCVPQEIILSHVLSRHYELLDKEKNAAREKKLTAIPAGDRILLPTGFQFIQLSWLQSAYARHV